MNWLDVLRRVEEGEDERTEFKRDLSNNSAIRKTLCAFANGDGGLLVVGVDDAGGIVGVAEDPENVQERLTSILHAGCGNPISARCDRYPVDDRWVHWVYVPRHFRGYEPFCVDGRFWIRRGRSTVAPSPAELQELFNVFGFILAEQQVVSSARPQDIDLDAFRTFMRSQGKQMDEEPQPEIENDLLNSMVCGHLENELRPTLYGLMVFGRDPQAYPHTTGMFVQCAAYAGVDRAAEVLSAGDGKGRLDEQVHRSVGWFRSLGRRESYQGMRRVDIPLLPEVVLREALVNAVIHRDYAVLGSHVQLEVFVDRIVVTSPGNLPNHMTVEQACFAAAPRSRNEMMANAMVVRQLMERRGRGWSLMRHKMREFNGTEPELVNSQDGRYVRVTFCLNLD